MVTRSASIESWICDHDTVRCQWVGKPLGTALVPALLFDEIAARLPLEIVQRLKNFYVVQRRVA